MRELIQLFKEHGHRKTPWAAIRENATAILPSRTGVDLKDKWRNLEKQNKAPDPE